jgi:hypothetical protein
VGVHAEQAAQFELDLERLFLARRHIQNLRCELGASVGDDQCMKGAAAAAALQYCT